MLTSTRLAAFLALVPGFLAGCSQGPQSAAAPRPAVTVEALAVETRSLTEAVRGIGTLVAKEQVEVRPEIAGRVVAVEFADGATVRRGAPLVRLDDRAIKAELAARRAEAAAVATRLANAERRHRRYESLPEAGAASRDERDTAETEYLAAQAEADRLAAEIARAEKRLADTVVAAPFTGEISESRVDVGDYVEESDWLATVYTSRMLEIALALPERHRARIAQGQRVEVKVAAHPDRVFLGKLSYIDPSIDVSTRSFLVKAEIVNDDEALTPGSFANAAVVLDVRENRAVVPERALVATRSGYIVFVVENDIARRREVEPGLREPGLVEIVSGLSPGEVVVTAGQMNLADGVPVAVLSTAPGA